MRFYLIVIIIIATAIVIFFVLFKDQIFKPKKEEGTPIKRPEKKKKPFVPGKKGVDDEIFKAVDEEEQEKEKFFRPKTVSGKERKSRFGLLKKKTHRFGKPEGFNKNLDKNLTSGSRIEYPGSEKKEPTRLEKMGFFSKKKPPAEKKLLEKVPSKDEKPPEKKGGLEKSETPSAPKKKVPEKKTPEEEKK